MEVEISRIHRNSTKHDVKREIAKFLHTEDFTKGLNDENSNIREM